MGDKKTKFRSAIGGYNKEDVNSYIEMLSTKYHNEDTENKEKIAKLEKKIKELEEELEEKGELSLEENKELKENAEKAENIISELRNTVDKLNGEKEEIVKENAVLRDRITELEKVNEDNAELYEKSSKYDKVSEQIGSMIVSANAKAESIVSEANLRARVASNEMINNVYDRLCEVNDKYTNEIITKTVQFAEELKKVSMDAEAFRSSTKDSVREECEGIKEFIESTKRVIVEGNNE